jgi:hypothetical protein
LKASGVSWQRPNLLEIDFAGATSISPATYYFAVALLGDGT